MFLRLCSQTYSQKPAGEHNKGSWGLGSDTQPQSPFEIPTFYGSSFCSTAPPRLMLHHTRLFSSKYPKSSCLTHQATNASHGLCQPRSHLTFYSPRTSLQLASAVSSATERKGASGSLFTTGTTNNSGQELTITGFMLPSHWTATLRQ